MFNFVTVFVEFLVVIPRLFTIFLRRNNRYKSLRYSNCPCLFIFICSVHKRIMTVLRKYRRNKFSALGSVMFVAYRQMIIQRISFRRGSQLNLCCEPHFRCPILYSPLDFFAPAESGCIFILVLSIQTISVRISIIFFICKASKIRSIVPFLHQRLNLTYIVCQFPYSLGNALHLQPFSIIYSNAHKKS